MNASALNYFQAYHLSYQGVNKANGLDYVFIFENTPEHFYPTPGIAGPAPQAFQYTQEYNTLYYWASLRSILITTSSIPISSEIIPANLNGQQQTVVQAAPPGVTPLALLTPANSGGQQYTAFPIITDYIVHTNLAGEGRSIAVYLPTSQYRLLDMSGESPISGVDVKIYWSDVQGNLYPLSVPPNQQVSLKIGFFKKSLYKGSSNLLLKS